MAGYIPYLVGYLLLCLVFWLISGWLHSSSLFFYLGQGVLFTIFILSVLYETFCNRRNYIPAYVKQNFFNLIENVQEIKTPFSFRAFNPGVIPYQEGYLMVARCEKKEIRKGRIEKKTFLVLTFLNKQFEMSEDFFYLHAFPQEKNQDICPEDPRLFVYRDRIYVCYNDCLKECNGLKNPPRFMCLAELACLEGKWGLQNILQLCWKRPERLEKEFTKNIEKNWTPFIYEDQIHFIYTYDPLIIIKPNLVTGECEEVSYGDTLQFTKPYKAPRGGTPACPVEDGFLAFYHICNTDRPVKRYLGLSSYGVGCYLMGAVEISKDAPFRILKKTKGLISGKALYTQKRKIEYPSSLIVFDDRYILFWGREDKKIMVGTIDREKLSTYMVGL